MTEHDGSNGWANGVTIKRTRDGYTWSIAVAANSNSPGDLREAAERAADLDAQLAERYPERIIR